jgi:hypothetical protein
LLKQPDAPRVELRSYCGADGLAVRCVTAFRIFTQRPELNELSKLQSAGYYGGVQDKE